MKTEITFLSTKCYENEMVRSLNKSSAPKNFKKMQYLYSFYSNFFNLYIQNLVLINYINNRIKQKNNVFIVVEKNNEFK